MQSKLPLPCYTPTHTHTHTHTHWKPGLWFKVKDMESKLALPYYTPTHTHTHTHTLEARALVQSKGQPRSPRIKSKQKSNSKPTSTTRLISFSPRS